MRAILLLGLSVLPSCVGAFDRHRASTEQTTAVPAAGLGAIECSSLNGDLSFRAVDGDEVRVRVAITAHGDTPEQASAHLTELSYRADVAQDRLVLAGVCPEGRWQDIAPVFAFTVEAPAGLELRLDTMNGDIAVAAFTAAVVAKTMNGDIGLEGRSPQLTIETMNGDVHVVAAVDDGVAGSLTSMNGDVHFRGGRNLCCAASTLHGDIDIEGGGIEAQGEKTARVRRGSTTRELQCRTTNGDIRIR